MTDTTTTNYELIKPEVGGSEDSWGDKLNGNWDSVDTLLKAISDVANAAKAAADAGVGTGEVTAAAILTKLLTVDGTGSGLDADLLDGKHASDFVLVANFTAAALLTKLLTVDGAGSGLDADKLDGQDSAYYTAIAARLGFTPANKAGEAFTGSVSITGDLTVTGDVTSSSDERLKDDIVDLDGAAMLEALRIIGGQSFLMGGRRAMGVVAQRVRAAGLGDLVRADDRDYLSVNYSAMVAPLIAAVAHLAARVEELERAR